ncbi:MAG: iron-sulfur cluster assembly protein, partial [Azospirillaceae bacterium]
MPTVTEAEVREALRGIRDPDRDADIVSLNMIDGLHLKDGRALVSIAVDPRRGERLEPMRAAAEQAVAALPGIEAATVVLTAHRAAGAGPGGGPGGGAGGGQAA